MTRPSTTLPFIKSSADPKSYDSQRKPITHIVMHTIVGTIAAADAHFKNTTRTAHTSSHYGVSESGQITQWVSEELVSYHAGNYGMNQCSIGIECEDMGKAFDPRPDTLYLATSALVKEICTFYGIPIDRAHVLMHREVPGAITQCPGTLDVDRIVQQASGSPTKQYDFYSQERNVTVTAPLGVYVRTGPSTTFPQVGGLNQGMVVKVMGYVVGDEVNNNSLWWKTPAGTYFWAGTTDYIPNPGIPKSETVLEPDPDPLPNTASSAEITVELATVKQQLAEYKQLSLDQKTKLDGYDKRMEEKIAEITNLQAMLDTSTVIRTANETLVKANESYKKQVTELLYDVQNAYVKAFEGWNLEQIPAGKLPLSKRLSHALSLLRIITNKAPDQTMVLGHKIGAKLYQVDTPTIATGV